MADEIMTVMLNIITFSYRNASSKYQPSKVSSMGAADSHLPRPSTTSPHTTPRIQSGAIQTPFASVLRNQNSSEYVNSSPKDSNPLSSPRSPPISDASSTVINVPERHAKAAQEITRRRNEEEISVASTSPPVAATHVNGGGLEVNPAEIIAKHSEHSGPASESGTKPTEEHAGTGNKNKRHATEEHNNTTKRRNLLEGCLPTFSNQVTLQIFVDGKKDGIERDVRCIVRPKEDGSAPHVQFYDSIHGPLIFKQTIFGVTFGKTKLGIVCAKRNSGETLWELTLGQDVREDLLTVLKKRVSKGKQGS